MALTDAFYEAVNSGNVRRVRIMMKDSLLIDPTFDEFDEMEEEAENMEGLYDEYDGEELIKDKSLWNDEYMNKLMVKVIFNFSHERIDHLKQVVGYLRPVEGINAAKSHNRSSYVPDELFDESDDETYTKPDEYLGVKIGAGAIAGAVVGGVIASVAGAPIAGLLSGIAAGAVLGGVTATIIASGGKDE